MSNVTSNTNLLGSTLPPHLSGASPTAYFCNNMVWQNIVETGKKIYEQKTNKPSFVETDEPFRQPITIHNNEESGYNELHRAAFMDTIDEQMFESVDYEELDDIDHNGNTPLMWASFNSNIQYARILIDQGVAVNTQNFVGETALFIAAARRFDKLCTLLIENGADMRLSNIEGVSPMHIATASGYVNVVKILFEHGAFVNNVDEEGDTPLHYAVREGRKEIVEFLVRYCGADINLKNEDEESPLDLALEIDERLIAEFLSTSSRKSINSSSSTDLPDFTFYCAREENNSERNFLRSMQNTQAIM